MWRQECKALWVLAFPLVAVQAGDQLKSLVDTAVMGRLGEQELAGVGLGNAFFFLIQLLGVGALMGFDPLIAQALGHHNHAPETRQRAHVLLCQSLWLALGLGLVLAIPVLTTPLMFEPGGIPPGVAREAHLYMSIRAVGLVPTLLFFSQRGFFQALEHTRPLVMAMVLSNIINITATILLAFGGAWLPEWMGPLRHIPAFGVAGSAWATVLSTLIQATLLALNLPRAPHPTRGWWYPIWSELRLGLKVGIPVGLQYGAEVGVFALVGFLAGRLGAVELAAHQVALTLAAMTFTITMGISAAGSVRVGRAIGESDTVRARVAGLVAIGSGTAFMGLGALVFLAFPSTLARLLTHEAHVIAVAAPLLGVAAVFQLSDGIQAVGAGVLRGAGDTRFTFVANVVGHYAVGL
ncbi:MAG: MATE family efflux transporter, partial [Myxococcota bacterium]